MSLTIKPLRAFLQKDTDALGKADPYVVLVLGNEKKKGKPHKEGGVKPQWNQTFQFNSKDTVLHIQIWDKDTFTPDDKMGQATYDLKKVYAHPNKPMTQNIMLSLNGKAVGGLVADVLYKGPAIGIQGQGGNQQGWGNQGNVPNVPPGQPGQPGNQSNWGQPQQQPQQNWGQPQQPQQNWGQPQQPQQNWGQPQQQQQNWGQPQQHQQPQPNWGQPQQPQGGNPSQAGNWNQQMFGQPQGQQNWGTQGQKTQPQQPQQQQQQQQQQPGQNSQGQGGFIL